MDNLTRLKDFRKDGQKCWAIKGSHGAVEFHYRDSDQEDPSYSDHCAGVEYHSKVPFYEGHRSLQTYYEERSKEKGFAYDRSKDICQMTDGECYCDGSSMFGEYLYDMHIRYDKTPDDEYIFTNLEGIYKEKFVVEKK
jgi:hypothetical protein